MLIMTLTEKHNVAQDFEQVWWNWHQVLQGQGRYLKGRCDYGHWTSKDYQRIPFHEQKAKSFPANLKPNCKWLNCNQKHSTHELRKKELLTYTALLMLKIKRLNATHCRPRRIHTQSITNPHPDTQSNNGEHFSSLQCMYRYIYIYIKYIMCVLVSLQHPTQHRKSCHHDRFMELALTHSALQEDTIKLKTEGFT